MAEKPTPDAGDADPMETVRRFVEVAKPLTRPTGGPAGDWAIGFKVDALERALDFDEENIGSKNDRPEVLLEGMKRLASSGNAHMNAASAVLYPSQSDIDDYARYTLPCEAAVKALEANGTEPTERGLRATEIALRMVDRYVTLGPEDDRWRAETREEAEVVKTTLNRIRDDGPVTTGELGQRLVAQMVDLAGEANERAHYKEMDGWPTGALRGLGGDMNRGLDAAPADNTDPGRTRDACLVEIADDMVVTARTMRIGKYREYPDRDGYHETQPAPASVLKKADALAETLDKFRNRLMSEPDTRDELIAHNAGRIVETTAEAVERATKAKAEPSKWSRPYSEATSNDIDHKTAIYEKVGKAAEKMRSEALDRLSSSSGTIERAGRQGSRMDAADGQRAARIPTPRRGGANAGGRPPERAPAAERTTEPGRP